MDTGFISAMSADEAGITQAVVCQGGSATALQPVAVPAPAAGEMLLGLRSVGFCGTDLFKLKTNSAAPGTVLGHEVVGTVEAVGPEVLMFSVGDRVVVPHHVACGECALCRGGSETMCATFKENLMQPGGFSDQILISRRATEQAAFAIPDDVSDEAAVFVEPAACVLRGIERSDLKRDGTAVVIGAGSMGLLHLLVLKAALPGVGVVMIDLDTNRLDVARRLGADGAAEPGPGAEGAVQELTDGLGADAIFDTVGGNATLQAGLTLSRSGGSVVLFAHAPEGMGAGFDLNTLFKHERRIIGTYSGALREQRRIFELICDGSLDPSVLVTHHMPLDDFETGVDLVVQQKALKVLFTPSRSAAAGGA
ncbi:MAG: alcohol dehydrogenase catalytic domain-containing protein [Alphaproteobacteria bacterium]|nr:alcohol dehydrogenase catalytic domain-containing protein [Alphaproteobacteria bacterium]